MQLKSSLPTSVAQGISGKDILSSFLRAKFQYQTLKTRCNSDPKLSIGKQKAMPSVCMTRQHPLQPTCHIGYSPSFSTSNILLVNMSKNPLHQNPSRVTQCNQSTPTALVRGPGHFALHSRWCSLQCWPLTVANELYRSIQ